MLIGHSLPVDWTYAIASGAFLTDPAALQDRAPAEAVQIQWPAGAQSTATTVQISGSRTRAFVPRVAALLGTSLPAGLRVVIVGKRAEDVGYTYDLGGNSMTQRLSVLPDGSVGCIWVLADGLDAITDWRVTLYNDVGGAAVVVAESEHLIGEIVVMPALDMPHDMGMKESWAEPSIVRRTPAAQVQRVPRTAYRILVVQPRRGTAAQTRGAALVDGMDFQRLCAALARAPFTLCVPYWGTAEEAQRSAVFGLASGFGIDGLPARWARMEKVTITEIPAAT